MTKEWAIDSNKLYTTSVKKEDFHEDTQVFFKDKKVAITGGTGFIGSHAVEQLLLLGAKPILLTRQPKIDFWFADQVEHRQCNLFLEDETLESMKGVDVVLNLAAKVGGLEFNKKHPASIFHENLLMFMNSIKAANELKVDRYLVTSSACVYPRVCSIPTPEEEGMKDSPEPTNEGYGWAKRMEEFLGAKYAEEFGLSVSIARPYNAYGPRDNFDPKSSHVIPALIRKAFETEGDTFEVWGDGSHSRSFLYVDDFARGLLEVAARYPKATPINIGSYEETTIAETAHAIAKFVSEIRGKEIQPKFNPTGLTGQPRRMCDTTMVQKELSYRTNVAFTKGLEETVRWFADYENSTMSSNA